jgi:hypothetical protein
MAMQNDQLIPLERIAYAAQAMYLQYPEEPFSVDEMVRGER